MSEKLTPALPPAQFLLALLTGLALRCPVCRRGSLYRSAISFHFNRSCPHCGAIFERDTGEVTGGMAINMVLTSILGTAAAIYLAVFTRFDVLTLAVWLGLGFTLFGLLFHRHARGLWVGVLYATGAMHEEHDLGVPRLRRVGPSAPGAARHPLQSLTRGHGADLSRPDRRDESAAARGTGSDASAAR